MRIKWFSLIRIIGLLWVLLYHFFIKFFPGGFVGVDLFYTLSGYLTTALLIDEFHQNKSVDLLSFYKRRFYRILPPLLFMILLATPLALLIRNDFIANIGRQILAALGFVTNVYELLSGGSYENQFTPHLFVHTWSLALEVHFYIFWGVIIWFLTRFCKSAGQLRGIIFLSSTCLFLLSFLSMFVSSFFVDNYSSIYFSTITHLFPFFMGSILATITGITHTTKSFQRILVQWNWKKALLFAVAGLLMECFLLFFLKFDSLFTYLFGFLLSSLATCLMIYATRVLHEKSETITEPAALQWLADISYGLYLFHWPLFLVFSQLLPSNLAILFTVLLSVIFATISFYLIEPFIAGKTSALFGLRIDLHPYKKYLAGGFLAFAFLTIIIALFAPKLGNLESKMMIDGLKQASTSLNQTKVFAEKGKASRFEIADGITIIGDSVTLRASEQIKEILPEAILDAQGSRNTTQANEILQNNIDNGTLLKNVVIATGVNIVYNYQEELDKLVNLLPNGYRLILVTPYDGNSTTYDNPVAEKHAQYIRQLAKKYDFITVADWNEVSKKNPQIWVGSDKIHFGGTYDTTIEGGKLFAQTIQAALKTAENKPVKNN